MSIMNLFKCLQNNGVHVPDFVMFSRFLGAITAISIHSEIWLDSATTSYKCDFTQAPKVPKPSKTSINSDANITALG